MFIYDKKLVTKAKKVFEPIFERSLSDDEVQEILYRITSVIRIVYKGADSA